MKTIFKMLVHINTVVNWLYGIANIYVNLCEIYVNVCVHGVLH